MLASSSPPMTLQLAVEHCLSPIGHTLLLLLPTPAATVGAAVFSKRAFITTNAVILDERCSAATIINLLHLHLLLFVAPTAIIPLHRLLLLPAIRTSSYSSSGGCGSSSSSAGSAATATSPKRIIITVNPDERSTPPVTIIPLHALLLLFLTLVHHRLTAEFNLISILTTSYSIRWRSCCSSSSSNMF